MSKWTFKGDRAQKKTKSIDGRLSESRTEVYKKAGIGHRLVRS